MSHGHLLLDDEAVGFHGRRHPIVLAGPIALAACGVVIGILLGSVITPRTTRDGLDAILGWVATALTLRAIWKVLAWRAEQVIVTDRRVLRVSGVLTRRVRSVPLNKLMDVATRRSGLGRLLGYGDISLESAGSQRGGLRFDHAARPSELRLAIALRHPIVQGGGRSEDVIPDDERDTGPLPRVIV
jgi:uncharacterized membrane protein YdbT with pleckstrin-like domain